jgi:hypothetical protein
MSTDTRQKDPLASFSRAIRGGLSERQEKWPVSNIPDTGLLLERDWLKP